MSMIVGLPGAGGDRDVVEAELPRVVERSVPPKRTPP